MSHLFIFIFVLPVSSGCRWKVYLYMMIIVDIVYILLEIVQYVNIRFFISVEVETTLSQVLVVWIGWSHEISMNELRYFDMRW